MYIYIYVCVYVYVYVYDIYIYKTPEQQKLLKNNRNLTTRNRDDSLGCLGYPWHYSISLWTKVKPNQPQHRHYVWVGPKIGTPKSSGSFQVLNKSMMETKFPSERLDFGQVIDPATEPPSPVWRGLGGCWAERNTQKLWLVSDTMSHKNNIGAST